jgi:predicted DNA-binding transcriptional regulator AlpA
MASANSYSIDSPDYHVAQIIKLLRRLTSRGLSRVDSAGHIGVSPSLFDQMVEDGRMPQPLRINSRVVWDRKDLDEAFEGLKDEPQTNPWDNEE